MIIVTGGAGLIGSAFIWKLNQQGITDILVVDSLHEKENWKNLVGLQYADYCHKDTLIPFLLDTKPDNLDAIIHMGACSSTTEKDGDYLMDNNYHYTKVLAEWCIDHNTYFLYASSAATYGDGTQGFNDDISGLEALRPINRYGYSKHLFDLYAKRKNILDKITGLKFFNVYGPNEYHKGHMRSVICKAVPQIQETGELKLFKSYKEKYEDGGQFRDFIYVKDCVEVMWWLLNNRSVTGVYNLGTGQANTWNTVAKAIFKAMNVPEKISYIDMPDNLINQYQYFTQAEMGKLQAAGCPIKFRDINDAIADYVQGYLVEENYLEA